MAFNYQAFYNSSPYGYGAQGGDMANSYQYNAVMSGTTASSSAQVPAFQSPSGGASHYAGSGSNSHMSQIGASNAGDGLSAYSQQHVYSPAFTNTLLGSAGFDGGNGFGEVQRLHQYGSTSGGSTSNIGTPYQTALRSAIESSMGSGNSISTGRRTDNSSGPRFNASSYSNASYGGGNTSGGSSYGGNKTGLGAGTASNMNMGMFPRATGPERWRAKRVEQKAARGGVVPQQHYCEICRVACAGSQTYKEHLEGRQHKKKEAAARELERLEKAKQAKLLTVPSSTAPSNSTPVAAATPAVAVAIPAAVSKPTAAVSSVSTIAPAAATAANKTEFRCLLCEIACTGAEAYAAHMRGQKHLRTLRLHQKMGRPIPPQAVPAPASTTASTATPSGNTVAPAIPSGWVVGGVLKVQDNKLQEVKPAVSATSSNTAQPAAASAVASGAAPTSTAVASVPVKSNESCTTQQQSSVPIVGSEYIVQRTNDKGQLTGFECKLCECSFTDLNGRDMHLRGKRHRLAYRQKVDPHFRVPDANTKLRRDENRFAAKKTRDDRVERTRETHWFEQAHVSNAFWSGPPGYLPPFGMPPFGAGGPYSPWMGYGLTRDDEYVQKRLKEVEPTADEAQALQRIVLTCERALKLVSDVVQSHRDESNHVAFEVVQPTAGTTDQLNTSDKNEMDTSAKKDDASNASQKAGASTSKPPTDSNPNRVLKGVVRVGALANCLLRHGDLSVVLVVLSAEKPTRRLLQLVYDELPRKLQQVLDDENDEESYTVDLRLDSGEILVCKRGEPGCECSIRLTSSLVREEALSSTQSVTSPQSEDLLDRDRCLEALALLRRAKWFQAKCLPHAPTVACLRLIRDLCARVSTWQPLSEWLTALLVQRCAETAPIPPCAGQPSLLLRRFFELIAGGFLVLAVREPQRYTLNDPCEKEPLNVPRCELTLQTAEDITASAQHALRLIAYHQMYKVISTEPITEEAHTSGVTDSAGGTADIKDEALLSADDTAVQASATEKMDTEAVSNTSNTTVSGEKSQINTLQRPVASIKGTQ